MEASGEPGEVNISSQTFALIADQFECIQRDSMEVKGKGTTQMYFVRKKS
jgi:class 3 adenylate cyclase